MDGGSALRDGATGTTGPDTDFSAYVGRDEQGRAALHLLVEGAHCGGCVAKIERALAAQPGVVQGRVNLTTKRLALVWQGGAQEAARLVGAVTDLGFGVVPFDPTRLDDAELREERRLLRSMAVAGFAAANVMLLSVAVWAGHAQGMGEATRTMLHWFSALIALPAIAFAGLPFFRSAWSVLRVWRTNMDVPISLAVVLAAGMSLVETMRAAEHAYFDSAVTLLFFLLIGRFLDRRARGRARSAAHRLLALSARSVTVIDPDGTSRVLPPDRVRTGMTVLVAAGERVSVDGMVVDGRSDLDTGLITGETTPAAVGPGDRVFAGTINQSAPIHLRVTAIGEDTLLGEIVRLMEAAEQRKARYVALADRMARHYAPTVHALAALTFAGWMMFGTLPWQDTLMIAVSVLIVTCPCALGLAVPAVQVIASGRLMRLGILLKSATALERFAEVDAVVVDKTGTLTLGRPIPRVATLPDRDGLALAASLAAASRHPLARALAAQVPGAAAAAGVREEPGRGLALDTADGQIRLGSRVWCDVDERAAGPADGPELWLARPGRAPHRIAFDDPLRTDAGDLVGWLQAQGLPVEILSGDRPEVVEAVATRLGIPAWRAGLSPADKVTRLTELAGQGRKVLMVGDGLNDAPALAAAHVSLSPSSAIDISQTVADAVFQGARLGPVRDVLAVAHGSGRVVRQNIALALGYNLIAVPLAVAGLVTPLIAAVCMSGSSIVVVSNALRLANPRFRWMVKRHGLPAGRADAGLPAKPAAAA